MTRAMCDCDRALELISLRLDGELTPEELGELEAHLAGCGDCRRAAEELRELHTLLPQLEEEVPPDLHRAIMDRIASEKVVPLTGGRKWKELRRWASLAAVFAVILLGAGAWQALQGGSATSGAAAPAALAPEVRDGTGSAAGGVTGGKAKEAESTTAVVTSDAALPEESGSVATQNTAEADNSTGAVLWMDPKGTQTPVQEDGGGENSVVQAPQAVTFGLTPAEAAPSLESEPDQGAVDTLKANCAAWLENSALEQRDRVDTGLASVATITQGDLAAAVCDDAEGQALLDGTDWAVTLGDTSGHDFVVLLCDSQTLEVLGYVPTE